MALALWAMAFAVPLLAGTIHAGEVHGASTTTPSGTGISSGGNSREADIAAARAQVAAAPGKSEYQVRLGWLLVQQGALDEALNCFEEVLRRSPRSAEARTGKGAVLARKGELRKAEQVLLEALPLNPRPARTHYELGLVYQKLDESDKALIQFREGIRVAR